MADERERRPETPAESDGTTGLFTAVGKLLRLLRERSGLTQKELGDMVGYGPDAIGAMERGVRVARPEVLEKADELLNAGEMLKAMIPEVKEAMKRARTRHPEWYRGYAALEAQAVELHHYCNQAVHGLLQTPDYARAVFSRRRPLLDEETIEKRVADRLARQQIFDTWPAPLFSYVLEEVVLDRPIGGPAVHAGQLRHLLQIGSMRNVEIQVMPTSIEQHPNMDGAFNLLTPKGHPTVAYTEIQGYPRLITDLEEVRKVADRYGIMRAMALTPTESQALIEKKQLGEVTDAEEMALVGRVLTDQDQIMARSAVVRHLDRRANALAPRPHRRHRQRLRPRTTPTPAWRHRCPGPRPRRPGRRP